MMQTNVLGVLRMTRAILPLMLEQPGSYIINIGSIAGRVVYEGGAAYCAAKAGELQITRALRLELSGTGVRVSTVDPGLAETEFSVVRFKGDTARAKKVYEGVTPLRAEDVADALVWVASRPPHVCIDEMIIKCTDQAAIHKVHRRTPKPPAEAGK
jgi:NADP-dependent 3-hydroxy acid dehydrogenase YdfG